MAVKHKNIFLYLTIVCFVGIILVFIVDGYMGVYDSLSITSGEYPQKIEADQWSRQDRYGYAPSANVERGGKVLFKYEVNNRQFSDYTADIEVSVWRSQEKVRDLISQELTVNSFAEGQLEWVMDTAELVPADLPPEQSYEFTVVIMRGDIERRIIVYINPSPYPVKAVIPSR